MKKETFIRGVRRGLPVGVGYFSVSFGFGAMAIAQGLKALDATLISLTNLTSAGQFAGLTVIAVYTDGSTKNISNWTLENLVADSVGESKEINILYEEDNISKSTNFTVNVFETDVLLVSFIFKEKEYINEYKKKYLV